MKYELQDEHLSRKFPFDTFLFINFICKSFYFYYFSHFLRFLNFPFCKLKIKWWN